MSRPGYWGNRYQGPHALTCEEKTSPDDPRVEVVPWPSSRGELRTTDSGSPYAHPDPSDVTTHVT